LRLTASGAGHLAMLAFSACVAGSFALGGLVANDIAPDVMTVLRLWLAAVVLGGAALAGKGLPRAAFAGAWRYGLLGFLYGIYFVLMFEGLKTAPPVSAAAVFTMTPLMAAGFGWVLLRQKLTGRMAVALVIGAAGAVWVIFRADWTALLAFQIGPGERIYFIGCVAHAFYAPLVRRLNRGETALVSSFGTCVAGAILLTVWSWSDLWAVDWAELPGRVWVTLAYLTVFATAASFVLLQFASLRLPAAKVMAYTYLVPSWVILWQLGLGAALPVVWVLTGVGLTIAALGLLLRD
jgi:drug/metabolite transporter (DMT)-like permease